MSEYVLELRNIDRTFEQGGEKLRVLQGASLAIRAGERVALIGPSGSGKSTLLQIAGLLEKPDGGEIFIAGQNVGGRGDAARTALRRTAIGFVYQYHHLLPEFSARENIILPQMVAGLSKRKAGARADELLALVGLSARASHRPAQLSGGEQQRVAIARALANRPCLLIADEPTGNLDPVTSAHVFDLLENLAKSQDLGLLMATHNHELANHMDKLAELRDGAII